MYNRQSSVLRQLSNDFKTTARRAVKSFLGVQGAIFQKSPLVICFCLVLVVAVGFTSCDSGGSVRKYKEKSPAADAEAAKATAPEGHPGSVHFTWETPEGWDENRAASGFRLAAFTIKSGDKESICTIIPLQGEAGGLEANATRWLGQITGTAQPSNETIKTLLKSQEKFLTRGQFPAALLDFTPVTPNPSDPSIIVTVVKVGGASVFIKMTGPRSHLIENKEKFKALCRSFQLQEHQS
jgi:hypothetical protein